MGSTVEEKICRLCANRGHSYEYIFNDNIHSIAEKIQSCLPIKITPNDKLPAHICQPCLETLNNTERFINRCLLAESIFKRQLTIVLPNNDKQINRQNNPKNKTKGLYTDLDEWNAFNKLISGSSDGSDDESGGEKMFTDLEELKAYNKLIKDSSDDLSDEDELAASYDVLRIKWIEEDNDEVLVLQTEDNEALINVEDVDDDTLIEQIDEEILPLADELNDETHCSTCNLTFEKKSLMKIHQKFHQSRSISCKTCHEIFLSPYDLYRHEKTAHNLYPDVKIKWFCDRCEKMLHHSSSLKLHMNQCTKSKSTQSLRYKCKYCRDKFTDKQKLLTHLKDNHADVALCDPRVKKFNCTKCNVFLISKVEYKNHLEMHRRKEERILKCSQCDRRFGFRWILEEHIQRVHRTESFVCRLCSEVFSCEAHLTRHKVKHKKN